MASLERFRQSFARFSLIGIALFAQTSNSWSVPSIFDQSQPTVRFVGVLHYARIPVDVPLVVQANDDTGVTRVELFVDRVLFATKNVVPNLPDTLIYFDWNTVAQGKHLLEAKVFDAAGNSQTTELVILAQRNAITPPPGNRITVLPQVSYQTMRGWQASGDTGLIEYISSHGNWTDAALNANVDIGINAVRIGLHSGIAENSTDYYGTFLANGQDATVGNGIALWQAVKDHWRIPVNDNTDPNSINPSGFKWSMVDWQIDKAVLPLKAKLAARGEQLYWTVTYIHFSPNNQIHVSNPNEYGELILALWQHLESRYGFFPNALEIFLEPDNLGGDPGNVSGAELAPMIIAARDRLVSAGYTKPDFIAPNTSSGPNARPYYLAIKSASATAASYIDVIGYHRYGNINDADLGTLRATANIDGKDMAMNEFGGNNSTYFWLHSDLQIGHNTLWEQYALAFPTSDNGYQYFTVGAAPNYAITIGSRAKFIQQYTRYIRRGAVMKGVINASANFSGVPFRNPNGTYVLPIKCLASGVVTVAGLPAGTYGIRYTTSTNYNVALPNQVIPSGGYVSFNMPASGVATVFNVNYLNAGSNLQ